MKNILIFVGLISTWFHGHLIAKSWDDQMPLFAGTLLASYAENTEKGRVSIQPFLFVTNRYGTYNENSNLEHDRNLHRYTGFVSLEAGLTKNIDVTLNLSGRYTHSNVGDKFHMNDTQLFFGFQIAQHQLDSWVPDIRVQIGESFPTGKYNDLDPILQSNAATGSGAYETWFIFITRKIFCIKGDHPYNFNLNVTYISSTKTKVKDFNDYGGGIGTKGVVKPGEQFLINLAYEYKFTQEWGWGFDIHYEYQNSSSFHSSNLIGPLNDASSSEQLSFAPLIEYNINADFSISGGAWFSVFGRNDEAFVSGIFTVFYEF